MPLLLHTFFALILLLAIPYDCMADIYKYRNANGRLTFVDDESKVPIQYRDDMTSISEPDVSVNTEIKSENAKASRAETLATQEQAERASKAAIKKGVCKQIGRTLGCKRNGGGGGGRTRVMPPSSALLSLS